MRIKSRKQLGRIVALRSEQTGRILSVYRGFSNDQFSRRPHCWYLVCEGQDDAFLGRNLTEAYETIAKAVAE